MRISSSNVQKEGNESSDSVTLATSEDVSESPIEGCSENINSAYRLLLSKNESEQKVKVAINFPFITYFFESFYVWFFRITINLIAGAYFW